MKIYFTYRTAYKSNLRFIKEFESNSIYDWFIENWKILSSDNYSDLLGTDVYGFPINSEPEQIEPQKQSFLSKLFGKKETQISNTNSNAKKPKNLQELIQTLNKGMYVNQIVADENSLRAETDDDEIGLCWCIFTERYKIENEDKVAIWFNEILPTTFGEIGKDLEIEVPILEEKGEDKGCTYFISCPVYDADNLADMTAVKIEGIRLNNLLDFLKNNELSELDDVTYAINELNYIKHIANELNSNDLKAVLKVFAENSITELHTSDFADNPLSDILEMELNKDSANNTINLHEHIAEISVNSMTEFYNYYIVIDDLWIEKNEVLAKSILYFGTNYDV